MKNKAINYQQEPSQSSDNRQNVSNILDKISQFIVSAKVAIKDDDIASKGHYVGDAITLLSVLQSSLEAQSGYEELADNLDNLYHYMINRLLKANLDNSSDILDEVNNLVLTLKSAWDEIN